MNITDTAKLVLLGIFIAAAARVAAGAATFPRWLVGVGDAVLPILVIGGLPFVVDSGALSAVLTVSLFLLLVWVAAVGWSRAAARGERRCPSAER